MTTLKIIAATSISKISSTQYLRGINTAGGALPEQLPIFFRPNPFVPLLFMWLPHERHISVLRQTTDQARHSFYFSVNIIFFSDTFAVEIINERISNIIFIIWVVAYYKEALSRLREDCIWSWRKGIIAVEFSIDGAKYLLLSAMALCTASIY